MQLPSTGDSQHQINDLDESEWTEIEQDLFKQLSAFYFDNFKEPGCSAASAELGKIIKHIEEVVHYNTVIYVAFDDDDTAYVLVDSAYKDYYNKRYLFEKLDDNGAYELFGDDFSEIDIISKARQAYESK